MKLKKRILSILLILALCMSMVPFSISAATLGGDPTGIENESSASMESLESKEVPDVVASNPVEKETPIEERTESETEEHTELPVASVTDQEYVPGFEAKTAGGRYAWPVPSSKTVSQGYGSGSHEALDIAADEGETVLAVEAGTVTVVQKWDITTIEGNQSYGNMVKIAHEDGNTTLYAHLSEIHVSEGEIVEKGQNIGSIGQTGNATGPHLHLELIAPYGRICPTDYITGEEDTLEEQEDDIPVYRVGNSSRMLRMVGERGKLRILYSCFQSDVGDLPTIGEIYRLPAKAVLVNETYRAAYCLQEPLAAIDGSEYTWSDLEFSERRLVGDLMALGFQWNSGSSWGRESAENYKWAVTQLLVWAIMKGSITRNADGIAVIPDAVDRDIEKAAAHSYNREGMISYYQNLKASMIKLRMIPSFAVRSVSQLDKAAPITLKWDGTQYLATVTDKNGVLQNYDFQIEGVNISKSGNTLSLSCTEPITTARNSKVSTYEAPGGEGAAIIWRTNGGSGGTGEQDFVSYQNDTDPVSAYIRVKTDSVGSVGLRKISEDGDVSGKSFQITGSDGSTVTKITDSSGSISLDGLPIYVSSEETSNGEESQGERIVYTAAETNVPIKYVIPASQTFQLYEGEETALEFENRLKKWRVTVTKTDRETGSIAQGDATLTGAAYGIYRNSILQDTYTTDSSGRFTTKYYPCGTGWTLKEISPSEGYLLNGEVLQVGMAPGETSVEYNSTVAGVKEQVIKGKISIVKHTDTGSTQIETPETGAEFEIYLTAAGSYSNAKSTERDILTINEAGYGITKSLPYGRYTVHQTKGWEGKEKVTDFQVFICEDDKTYPFIINNRVFESYIQVVKRDAETGRVIPASGIGFKIKDLTSGKWVSQHINYPTPMDLDTYYTDVTGRLMLPELLGFGTYELYETNSAYGYVISTEPVEFVVDGTAKTVVVEMGNIPQKGILTIEKTGDIFQSVQEKDGIYQPIYEESGLSGAVYVMEAAEDIVTLDGTKRYAVGEEIQRVETDSLGKAKFPAVYLGKYKVYEITAPNGYVLDPAIYQVEFVYGGQDVSLLSETLMCTNTRQKLEINLAKALEKDDIYHIGAEEEYKTIRFGLFAAEEILAADGKSIPKDGLIEEIGISENGQAFFQSSLPFGDYYVRETSTDVHYLLPDTIYPISFKYAGSKKAAVTVELNEGATIENILKRGKISGLKTDTSKMPLAGAAFGIFPSDTESFTESEALAISISDEEGKFEFLDIPFGKWLVKELKAPNGYSLSSETFEADVTEDSEVLHCTFENRKIPVTPGQKYGRVIGLKTDENDKPLAGITFGLFREGTTSFTFDTAIAVAETDKEGNFCFENVPCDKWLVKELTALPGYVLLTDQFEAEISAGCLTADLGQIINKHVYGNLHLTKFDKDYPENKLSGAIFEVYQDSNGNKELDQEDELLGTMKETEKGQYEMKDVYGGILVKEQTAPEGFRLDENTYYVMIDTEGKTYEIENEAGKGFYNEPLRGGLKIVKTSFDGRKEGFSFRITGEDYDETLKTDAKGEILVESLRVGKYTVSEIEDSISSSYKRPKPVTVELIAGETLVVNVHNDKGSVEIPKTGDNFNLWLWIALMIFGLAGVSLVVLASWKQYKKTR